MNTQSTPLPSFMSESASFGTGLEITGKWTPKRLSGWLGKSSDSKKMYSLLRDLKTTVNKGVGKETALRHDSLQGDKGINDYITSSYWADLQLVASPGLHLIRGEQIDLQVVENFKNKGIEAAFGEFLYGYVRDDRSPNPAKTIEVTAKWTCKPGSTDSLNELKYWWQRVGTEAHDIEKGLIRFEVYQVVGEDALIIHETFEDSKELQFHLSKGTAHKYKDDIDKIAIPENYYFRGPVAWTIRTFARFMKLPATFAN